MAQSGSALVEELSRQMSVDSAQQFAFYNPEEAHELMDDELDADGYMIEPEGSHSSGGDPPVSASHVELIEGAKQPTLPAVQDGKGQGEAPKPSSASIAPSLVQSV